MHGLVVSIKCNFDPDYFKCPTMSSPSHPQIDCKQLSKRFITKGEVLSVYENISFQVQAREFVCLLGPSGCGKTTLLRTIAGLEMPSQGELIVDSSTPDVNPEIGMVFQEQGLFPWMTVYNNLAFIVESNPNIDNQEIPQIVNEFLRKVGLEEFSQYYPHQLSGGMKQRVMIAMAMACEPGLLIADEPTTALDVTVQAEILTLMKSLQTQKGTAILLITHDLGIVAEVADRVAVMYAGRIVEMASRERLLHNPAHPYTTSP